MASTFYENKHFILDQPKESIAEKFKVGSCRVPEEQKAKSLSRMIAKRGLEEAQPKSIFRSKECQLELGLAACFQYFAGMAFVADGGVLLHFSAAAAGAYLPSPVMAIFGAAMIGTGTACNIALLAIIALGNWIDWCVNDDSIDE